MNAKKAKKIRKLANYMKHGDKHGVRLLKRAYKRGELPI